MKLLYLFLFSPSFYLYCAGCVFCFPQFIIVTGMSLSHIDSALKYILSTCFYKESALTACPKTMCFVLYLNNKAEYGGLAGGSPVLSACHYCTRSFYNYIVWREKIITYPYYVSILRCW